MAICPVLNHSLWKLATAVLAFGSWSMRRTCASMSAGALSVLAAAASNNALSGMVPQRKYESRVAISYGATGATASAAAVGIGGFHSIQEICRLEHALDHELDAVRERPRPLPVVYR